MQNTHHATAREVSRSKGSVFSPNTPFFFTNVPGSPHTSSYISGHRPATVRRAGRKRGARSFRALRLWQSSRQWRAVPCGAASMLRQ
eukprot:scaffold95585_cov57-Phaeocystis_antarctica.AAC.1